MENSTNTAMMALDLSAAFDTINHKACLDVLNKCFGIQGTGLQWIKSYLMNRQFCVQIKDQFSDVKTVDFTVPQDSIQGPVLFPCYASTL